MHTHLAKSLRSFLRAVRIEEWIAIISAWTALMVNVLVYHESFSVLGIARLMLKYLTFGEPYYWILFLTIYLLYIWKFYWLFAKLISGRILKKEPFPEGSSRELIRCFLEPLRIGLPFVLIAVSFYGLLGSLNYNLRFSGQDLALLAADRALTGVIPFLYLPAVIVSPLWAYVLKYSYYSLAIVMGATMGVFFIMRKTWRIFRQTLIAFIFSLVIGFPIFAQVPCQDPNNYFIRNLRGNTFSKDITEALNNYRPLPQVQQSIEKIGNAETNEARDWSVPISCFPSMHAVWAFSVIYFLAVIRRKSLFFSIPWVVLLLIGGIYYAQHYVVDYIIALPVAALSIWLSYGTLKLEKRWRN